MINPMSINCILTKALGNLLEIDEIHYQILQQSIKSLDRFFRNQLLKPSETFESIQNQRHSLTNPLQIK